MMNCMSNKMRVKCLLSVDGNVVQQFLYQYIDFVHMPMHPIKKTSASKWSWKTWPGVEKGCDG